MAFSLIGVCGIYLQRERIVDPLFIVLGVSVIGTMGYTIILESAYPRYLLPLNGLVWILLYQFIIHWKKDKLVKIGLSILMIASVVSIVDFKNFSEENKSSIETIMQRLEENEINYVYCEGRLLQWQLMFYSKEAIIGRFKGNSDRYPTYVDQTDSVYKASPMNVALVGSFEDELLIPPANTLQIDEDYFIVKNPTKAFLKDRGFDLSKYKPAG